MNLKKIISSQVSGESGSLFNSNSLNWLLLISGALLLLAFLMLAGNGSSLPVLDDDPKEDTVPGGQHSEVDFCPASLAPFDFFSGWFSDICSGASTIDIPEANALISTSLNSTMTEYINNVTSFGIVIKHLGEQVISPYLHSSNQLFGTSLVSTYMELKFQIPEGKVLWIVKRGGGGNVHPTKQLTPAQNGKPIKVWSMGSAHCKDSTYALEDVSGIDIDPVTKRTSKNPKTLFEFCVINLSKMPGLLPSHYCNSDSVELRDWALNVIGHVKDPHQQIVAVLDHIMRSMRPRPSHEHKKKTVEDLYLFEVERTALNFIKNKFGSCVEISNVLASVARMLGHKALVKGTGLPKNGKPHAFTIIKFNTEKKWRVYDSKPYFLALYNHDFAQKAAKDGRVFDKPWLNEIMDLMKNKNSEVRVRIVGKTLELKLNGKTFIYKSFDQTLAMETFVTQGNPFTKVLKKRFIHTTSC